MGRDAIIVAVALGGGLGRIPKAPGTFGSLLGMLWFGLLISLPDRLLSLALLVGSFPVGVWICTEAERVLKQHDPACIVIDEILAVPVAGLGWVLWCEIDGVDPGSLMSSFSSSSLLWIAGIFGLFRFFDIAKPWPVGISQGLPRGWGVMADDLLAALYVAGLTFVIQGAVRAF